MAIRSVSKTRAIVATVGGLEYDLHMEIGQSRPGGPCYRRESRRWGVLPVGITARGGHATCGDYAGGLLQAEKLCGTESPSWLL